MKNILILGFVSLLLFAVAAGLSMTLNQPKPVAKEDEKDKEKKGLKDDKEKPSAKEEKKATAEAPKPNKDDTPVALAAEQKAKDEELKRRAERQAKKEAQQALILKDLREMRDEEDRVAKLIAAEVKLEKAREDATNPSPTTPPVPTPKKGSTPPQTGTPFASAQPDAAAKPLDPAEKKQLERLAVIYEAMPPETAAKLFQEQADSGKLETVVKVMGFMRERASGKVISEIPDRALAAQIMDRMLQQKKPAAPLPPN